jgi:hypothetical protein
MVGSGGGTTNRERRARFELIFLPASCEKTDVRRQGPDTVNARLTLARRAHQLIA